MITLHLEAESYFELEREMLNVLQITDKQFQMLKSPAYLVADTSVITTEDLRAQLAAEAEPAPKKGETAEIKAAIVGKPDDIPTAAPAFLSEEKAAEAVEEVTLDAMREVAHKLAGTEGKGMPAVADILKTFKDDKGAPCVKMSQVQAGDRAKAIAAFEAAMKG